MACKEELGVAMAKNTGAAMDLETIEMETQDLYHWHNVVELIHASFKEV